VGLDTYALFLDYQKAFDTVPHAALFLKIERLGVCGRMLTFLKALYKDSMIQVRSPDGSYCKAFPLLRGVRQGCPLSPTLFDLYINDIFDDCTSGVAVPEKVTRTRVNGLATTTIRMLGERIPGLKFADDAVALSDTTEDLRRSLECVIRWSKLHEMTFGVKKCGLLHFTKEHPNLNFFGSVNTECPFGYNHWEIDGVPIPIVTEYTYLGLDFNHKLDLEYMSKARAKIGRSYLEKLRPFLKCESIPVTAKRSMVTGCILQGMLYGAELWGMRCHRGDAQQTILNKAARWILNHKGPPQLLSVGAMMQEVGLTPIYAQIATRRTRAYLKYPTLATWVATLVRRPLRTQKKTWLTITEMWLNRFGKAGVGPRHTCRFESPKEDLMLMEHIKGVAITRVYNRWQNSAPRLRQYLESSYRPAIFPRSWTAGFGPALLLLSVFRTGGYACQHKMAKTDNELSDICYHCIDGEHLEVETKEHILLHCPAWAELRALFIGGLIREATNLAYAMRTGKHFFLDKDWGEEPFLNTSEWPYDPDFDYGSLDTQVFSLVLGGRISWRGMGVPVPRWLHNGHNAVRLQRYANNLQFSRDIHANSSVPTRDTLGPERFWDEQRIFRVASYLSRVDTERARKHSQTGASEDEDSDAHFTRRGTTLHG
jgi:hypothetical protein